MTDTQERTQAPTGAPSSHESEGWRKLAPVVGAAVAAVVLSLATGSFPLVAFVFAVIAMIMLHEAGHFVTAKWSGMKVTEFFFGFGPRLWSLRRGETTYGVKAAPLGGYVKILGMSNLEKDIDPADEPRTYRQQSYPKRMLVAAAGIVTHFVVAVVVLTLLWTVVGVPGDKASLTVAEISRLQTGESPAQQAGFQVGDRIVSYDDRTPRDWEEVRTYIRSRPDQPINLVVVRDGKRITLTVTPTPVTNDDETVGFIGLGPQPVMETTGPVDGVLRAGHDVGVLTWRSIGALGSFFSPSSLQNYANLVTDGARDTSEADEEARPVSIVGVVRIAGQAAETGWFNVLNLFVVLNIFVGVFNMIPLLPFDGGHIAIATYERFRSRRGRPYRADIAKMMPVTAAVVVLMLMLGLTTIWLDIFQPPTNPFR